MLLSTFSFHFKISKLWLYKFQPIKSSHAFFQNYQRQIYSHFCAHVREFDHCAAMAAETSVTRRSEKKVAKIYTQNWPNFAQKWPNEMPLWANSVTSLSSPVWPQLKWPSIINNFGRRVIHAQKLPNLKKIAQSGVSSIKVFWLS